MRRLLALFLLVVSSSAFIPREFFFEYDDFVDPNTSSSRQLARTPPLAPYQRDVPHPKTPEMMQERFKEDLLGILDFSSRAHFDDLAFYIPDVRVNMYSKEEDYVHGKFSYNASGANGKWIYGRWAYKATMDYNRHMFLINYILFAGDCHAIPKNVPSEPTEDVDHYIERVRVKLANGLFLPDGEPQTRQNFEDFGEFIAEDAHILVCDEPKMNADEFIEYMTHRYHHIRKYKDNQFSIKKNLKDFELTFSTTWTAANTSEFRDTYVFRTDNFFPELNKNFYLWKVYWVTKKCTMDVSPEMELIAGSTQIAEVNKRFSDMIDGQNWDVFDSFLDLFDASRTVWGTCTGAKKQEFHKIRPYMMDVSMRYAKAVVARINIRNLTSVDFTTTFLVSRATEVQEQEELDVGFAGYKDPKTHHWKMTKMYFECEEGHY